MKGITKNFKRFFSTNNTNKLNNKRFNPTSIGLNDDFSLLKYSNLRGWGCKVPQNVLFNYLKDVGDGSIGRETPDCSVTEVKGMPNYVCVTTTDFFYPVKFF